MALAAQSHVQKALRLGLKKPDICEKCGKKFPIRKIHGHHSDYRKPLQIMWVCPQCHRQIHKTLNWLESQYEWLLYCEKEKLDPGDARLPWLNKKTGAPTSLTIYEHWRQNEYRITR